jgi:hypothetical protein
MAEAPIGKNFNHVRQHKLIVPSAVLDGGTGFLKVGYAAQV